MKAKIMRILKPYIKPLLVRSGYYTRPTFMIIGAQKAGTSALFRILNQHSMLMGSDIKELHYFENDKRYNAGKLWKYHLQFPLPFKLPKGGQTFEATPGYIFFPQVAARLYQYNPRLKLIVILRDPTQRAFSAWRMLWNEQLEDPARFGQTIPDFRTAIEEDFHQLAHPTFSSSKYRHYYIERGLYQKQIEHYLQYFPKEQILIIESQELKSKHKEIIKDICHFLNIPAEELPPLEAHVTKPLDCGDVTDVLKRLQDFYYPYNENLFDFLGKRYDWNDLLP